MKDIDPVDIARPDQGPRPPVNDTFIGVADDGEYDEDVSVYLYAFAHLASNNDDKVFT